MCLGLWEHVFSGGRKKTCMYIIEHCVRFYSDTHNATRGLKHTIHTANRVAEVALEPACRWQSPSAMRESQYPYCHRVAEVAREPAGIL